MGIPHGRDGFSHSIGESPERNSYSCKVDRRLIVPVDHVELRLV